jgi:hypothetical protein
VQMRFWRFAAAEIPTERDAFINWLYARWIELDEWIEQTRVVDEARISAKAGGHTSGPPPPEPLPT